MSIFEEADAKLLPGFERRIVEVGGQPVRVLTKGSGPALLMLHGDPQTHLCWHRMAPELAGRFSVVLTDIRGRGETHKPGPVDGGNAYTKREMAADYPEVVAGYILCGLGVDRDTAKAIAHLPLPPLAPPAAED